jgi:hypothetical protein
MLDHISAVALQHQHRPLRQAQGYRGFKTAGLGLGDVLAKQDRFFGAKRKVTKGPQEVVVVHCSIDEEKGEIINSSALNN